MKKIFSGVRPHENAVREEPVLSGRHGARQTGAEAVLNVPHGQCWPCDAAGCARAALEQADS